MGANDGRDPLEDYRIINEELANYEYRLMERPQIVLANKMDLEHAEENLKRFKEAYPDVEVFETTTIIAEDLSRYFIVLLTYWKQHHSFHFTMMRKSMLKQRVSCINLNRKHLPLRFVTSVTDNGSWSVRSWSVPLR